MSQEYCIARHDDKMSFLSNCRYHILLLGNVEELLQKLDRIRSTYQWMDCLYTLFKYRFSGNIVVKSGQVFDNVQRISYFYQRNRGVDRMPSIVKKRFLRSLESIYWAPSKRQHQRKLVDQSLQKELNKLIRQYELEKMKTVNCFLDGYGSYSSYLVTFEIKSL